MGSCGLSFGFWVQIWGPLLEMLENLDQRWPIGLRAFLHRGLLPMFVLLQDHLSHQHSL